MSGVVQTAFQFAYEISPIFLVGGIAAQSPLGVLPIVALTESASFLTGILSGNPPTDLNNYFCHFVPIGGAKLISNDYAKYPFANQSIAANAVIQQPLTVSLEMICPATESTPYLVKLATITAMQFALNKHIASGGYFTVATPAFVYPPALLLDIVDTTTGGTGQKQIRYQWNFWCPLVTIQQAQGAQSRLMQNITNGTQTDGQLTGPGLQPGNAPINTQYGQGAQGGGYGGGLGGLGG